MYFIINFILTGGNVHEAKIAPEFISMSEVDILIGDKGYYSKSIRQQNSDKGFKASISNKKTK